jgi:hypothetical protein
MLIFRKTFTDLSSVGKACPWACGMVKDLMHSSLSGFSGAKNIWVKVTLGRVKNTGISKPNLHPHFSVQALGFPCI